jgi:hypothetical protein
MVKATIKPCKVSTPVGRHLLCGGVSLEESLMNEAMYRLLRAGVMKMNTTKMRVTMRVKMTKREWREHILQYTSA